jgi:hypothetical protein
VGAANEGCPRSWRAAQEEVRKTECGRNFEELLRLTMLTYELECMSTCKSIRGVVWPSKALAPPKVPAKCVTSDVSSSSPFANIYFKKLSDHVNNLTNERLTNLVTIHFDVNIARKRIKNTPRVYLSKR